MVVKEITHAGRRETRELFRTLHRAFRRALDWNLQGEVARCDTSFPNSPAYCTAEHVYIVDVERAFIDFDCRCLAAPAWRARLIERLQRLESDC